MPVRGVGEFFYPSASGGSGVFGGGNDSVRANSITVRLIARVVHNAGGTSPSNILVVPEVFHPEYGLQPPSPFPTGQTVPDYSYYLNDPQFDNDITESVDGGGYHSFDGTITWPATPAPTLRFTITDAPLYSSTSGRVRASVEVVGRPLNGNPSSDSLGVFFGLTLNLIGQDSHIVSGNGSDVISFDLDIADYVEDPNAAFGLGGFHGVSLVYEIPGTAPSYQRPGGNFEVAAWVAYIPSSVLVGSGGGPIVRFNPIK